MDPQTVFCPNPQCLASGQIGRGTIHVHSRKEERYRWDVCGQTFSATTGTPFYRAHTRPDEVIIVITLWAYGCPPQASVRACEWDERTVPRYPVAAGAPCEAGHEQLVAQPRDLGQVQADEIRMKGQGIIMWLAMAVQVSTRLWLGGWSARSVIRRWSPA